MNDAWKKTNYFQLLLATERFSCDTMLRQARTDSVLGRLHSEAPPRSCVLLDSTAHLVLSLVLTLTVSSRVEKRVPEELG